jgi:ubiquinone/menaquinone biosynthesis C-methylase UbiE
MAFFSRRPPVRVVRDKAIFGQPDFAAEYNSQVGKSTADFQPILDYLSSQIDPARHAEVLEIGPGPGWIGIRLAQSHPAVRVTGIDISAAFVEIANENSRREGVADRVTFVLGNAAEMKGFTDSSFDAVFSFQSLHYWDPPERALDEIARVLKPSGVVCIGDDRRDMQWQGKLQVLLGRFLLSRRIGTVWARSVVGCLTPPEAVDALQRSGLRDRWQMAIRPRSMLITSKPFE